MVSHSKGRYAARLAATADDQAAALGLRSAVFRGGAADVDAFDPACSHILVEEVSTGTLVCTFRLLPLEQGADIGNSYAAQFYELSALAHFDGPLVEMGRFCLHPDYSDPDILRVAWAAMTAYVDDNGVEMVFGCASFQGVEAEVYTEAFALLKEKYLAPKRWLPRVKSPSVFRFARALRLRKPNLKAAMQAMPPLLRSYLAMGGRVSDHAVVDHDLGTLHVFTGLEISAVPPARARLLRAVSG